MRPRRAPPSREGARRRTCRRGTSPPRPAARRRAARRAAGRRTRRRERPPGGGRAACPVSRRRLQRRRADAGAGVGPAAVELQAFRLQQPADLRRVAEGGPADRAVGLQDAVSAGQVLADEALVERARGDVAPAGGGRHVAVAHPRAGRDRGDDLSHAVEIHVNSPFGSCPGGERMAGRFSPAVCESARRSCAYDTDCWNRVKPIAAQTEATIQKRRMIFVSDQASSSKWWWIGAIRNTRFRKRWKANTWTATDSASITKMPPIINSSTSVLVRTASAAIAPPRPSEPVSPMKTPAGNELNQRKPTQAPTRQADSNARSRWPFVMNVIAVKASSTIAQQPAARPSRPSVRFTPFVAPASTRKISSG